MFETVHTRRQAAYKQGHDLGGRVWCNYAKRQRTGTVVGMSDEQQEPQQTDGVADLAAWRQQSDAQRWGRLADSSIIGTKTESDERSKQLLQHLGLTQPATNDEDLADAALILARVATDTGARTDLNVAIGALGYDREVLEAEIDRELADGILIDWRAINAAGQHNTLEMCDEDGKPLGGHKPLTVTPWPDETIDD